MTKTSCILIDHIGVLLKIGSEMITGQNFWNPPSIVRKTGTLKPYRIC